MDTPIASFREAGAGPMALCLHSSASTSGQWAALMDRLAGEFHVVAADLYGYGRSPAWPGERTLTLDDEIALLAPVLERGEPVHLVGHSYGGLNALKIAIDRPERIASLVVYEPTCFFLLSGDARYADAEAEIRAIRDETSRLVDAGEIEAAARRFVDYWVGDGAWSATPESRRPAVARTMRKVRCEWTTAFDQPLPEPAIARLPMPVMVMSGTRTTAPARGVVDRLRTLLPGARTLDFDGLGHMGPMTHPAPVNEAIAEFLHRVA